MGKVVRGYNVNAIKLGEKEAAKLKKLSESTTNEYKNSNEKNIMDEGEKCGYQGLPIPEKYKNSKSFGVFQRGYLLGKRRRYVEEIEKNKQRNKQIIENMIKENRPIEEASEEIKNDPSLVAYYNICKFKAGKGKRK